MRYTLLGRQVPLEPDAEYRVVGNSYIRRGGDSYAMLKDETVDSYDFVIRLDQALAEYVKAHSPVSRRVEGRIKRIPD